MVLLSDPTLFEIVYFLSIWIVSAFVLLISAKLLASKGGFVGGLIASLLGSIVFYFFRGNFLFSLAAALLWLLVIRFSFDVGWIRAFLISIIAYILASLVSAFLGIPLLP
jgi:hypothetical protein